jgi:S-(hydroxymethyl)glutathione dehydrogenase/alcohol dehydrogenase
VTSAGSQLISAAVLHEVGEPLRVERVELESPRAGEVRVRVAAAGVCHSDYHYMTGDLVCRLPVVVGHEGAGRVEAVGPGTERVRQGDAVALLWRPRCGVCRFCIIGQPVLCERGRVQAESGGLPGDGTTRLRLDGHSIHHLMGVSCLAEQVVVSEMSVVPIPDGVPPVVAAITGCAVITGVGAVLNVAGAVAGSSLLIIGAGGVGLSAVMGGRLAGADPIVATDVEPSRLERARQLGATHVVDAGTHDVVESVTDLVPGGVDWAIDAVGRPGTLQQSIACLRPGGTAIAVGLARVGETVQLPINELVQRQKRLVGSLYGSANPQVDLPRLFELYRSGRLALDELVGTRYRLAEVNEAYAALAHDAVGRSVVVMDS